MGAFVGCGCSAILAGFAYKPFFLHCKDGTAVNVPQCKDGCLNTMSCNSVSYLTL